MPDKPLAPACHNPGTATRCTTRAAGPGCRPPPPGVKKSRPGNGKPGPQACPDFASLAGDISKEVPPFTLREPLFTNRWNRTRYQQLVREDLRDLTSIHELGKVETLVEILADRSSQQLSYSSLVPLLQVSVSTARRWVMTLCRLYLGFLIRPWWAGWRGWPPGWRPGKGWLNPGTGWWPIATATAGRPSSTCISTCWAGARSAGRRGRRHAPPFCVSAHKKQNGGKKSRLGNPLMVGFISGAG